MDYALPRQGFKVEAYAGFKGEDTPRAFTLSGSHHVVVEILDHWYSETHSYFRVRTADGRYVLRFDLDRLEWELVMEEHSR